MLDLAAEALAESLNSAGQGITAKHLAVVVKLLPASTRDHISANGLTVLLDYEGSSSTYYSKGHLGTFGAFGYTGIRFGAEAISDPRSLAKLFSHPGCVGEPREILLQRFEELLFHDGKPVFLTKPEPETEAQPSPQTQPEPPPRRFHNLHDAAAWIQQNWPDFDLETNHPVTWRSQK